jgi:hypothetical protein
LRAVYITYAIKEHVSKNNKIYKVGDIVAVEMKIKGRAPKVADRQRDEWQSVLRCSMNDFVKRPDIATISGARVVNNKVVIGYGDNIITLLEEDVVNSIVYAERIEDV